jgi:sugar (pentulose or hexulose) kinase
MLRMSDHILTIDVGTQSVRAAVVEPEGDILGIAQTRHDVDAPRDGWAQQRPDSWWKMVVEAARRVLDETSVPRGSIAAVSTCGQMHAPVGVDEEGNTTTEWAQLWCDKRCVPQCEEIRRTRDEDALSTIAANPINPAWTGLKTLWIKQTQPEVYDRTRWFLVPKDFINFRLTGVAAADPSEASGSFLWDASGERYSPELAEALDLDLARFAPVSPSHEVIGTVTMDAAQATGLAEGTPVVAGGGDFPVSLLGSGIVGAGVAVDSTGSSSLLAVHGPVPLIHPAVQNLRHVVDGWIPFTILDSGGLSMKWCRELIASARDGDVSYEQLIEMAQDLPRGSDGLTFYPYMLGERRHDNTDARGALFGMTLNHTAGHVVRAIMEGTACAIEKDLALFRRLGAGVGSMYCSGGATRNDLWNRIKADVFGMPVTLSDEPEAGIRGAALLGAAGVGIITDLEEAASRRRGGGQRIVPDEDATRQYRPVVAEFNRIYEHMLGFRQRKART